MPEKLALGLDLSTQSITAVVVDMAERKVVYEKSLDYLADPRLNTFGLNRDYLLPPTEPGEANQPAGMFLAALDAILGDLVEEAPVEEAPGSGFKVTDISIVNFSVQQHGHVHLGDGAKSAFSLLRNPGVSDRGALQDILGGCFATEIVKTWRTSNTGRQADFVRDRVGGKKKLIEISGSDAPLRFSAFSIRKTAEDSPETYAGAVLIQPLNTFLAAVMTGETGVPLDYGNACGLSLMDYRERRWSDELTGVVSDGLPGGADALRGKLPALASGMAVAGDVARYFVEKYGMNPRCLVGVGSGDNSQSKVLAPGTLLSLGSSLVLMADLDGSSFDLSGSANAMYDPFDRPFMFGCRTNGALRWDDVRAMYGHGKTDFGPAEAALRETPPGNRNRLFLWQAETESFPKSLAFEPVRVGYSEAGFAQDYAGIVESTLGLLYLYSRGFTEPAEGIVVTGGAAASPQILRRVAAIWSRTVIPVSGGGSALGAALSGACALMQHEGTETNRGEFIQSFIDRGKPVEPAEADMDAYRGTGGYLDALLAAYESI
jgi:xylulokinase